MGQSREERIRHFQSRIRIGSDPAGLMAMVGTTNPNHPAVERLREREQNLLLGELTREIAEERQEKLRS